VNNVLLTGNYSRT